MSVDYFQMFCNRSGDNSVHFCQNLSNCIELLVRNVYFNMNYQMMRIDPIQAFHFDTIPMFYNSLQPNYMSHNM